MRGQRPSPPDESQELTATEARGARPRGIVRYILAVSTALVIVLFIVAYIVAV